MRILLSLIILTISSSFLSTPAFCSDPVELQIITRQVEGRKPVGLKLIANEMVNHATLIVNGHSYTHDEILAGKSGLIAISQETGKVHYVGTLSVTFHTGEEASVPLEFDLEVLPGLKVAVADRTLDLEKKSLSVLASRPVSRIEYTVLSDTGTTLDKGERAFNPPVSESAAAISWGGQEGTVIRINLTIHDTESTYAKLELTPWFIEVEHEEVHFASGSAEILPDQAPKLDHAYELLQEKIKQYGQLIQLSLYIVGYTDTVGDKKYNLVLSENRARSIAKYLRKKGVTFPIFYQGFGEEILAVTTPDETDEAKNRRALYLLGGDYRPRGVQIPSDNWQPLK